MLKYKIGEGENKSIFYELLFALFSNSSISL